MISVLSKLFEEMCYESFIIFSLICLVVISVVIMILLILILKNKINLMIGAIASIIIGCFMLKIIYIIFDKDKEIMYETYQTNLDKGYTVYLEGEKVSYPDKIILDEYKIEFDDEDKEILLRKEQ